MKGVSCSFEHAICWDTNGSAYSWGKSKYGKLGHPNRYGVFKDSDFEVMPRRILSLEGKYIIMAALGKNFSLLLDSSGRISSIGLMRPLRSSAEPEFQLLIPQELTPYERSSILKEVVFVKICCGDEHCLATDKTGKLYSWGLNFQNCIGSKTDSIKEPTLIEESTEYSV